MRSSKIVAVSIVCFCFIVLAVVFNEQLRQAWQDIRPLSKSEIVFERAEIARLQGEIKSLDGRLSSRKLSLDKRVLSSLNHDTKQRELLLKWQQLADVAVFSGDDQTILDGVLAAAQSFLNDGALRQSKTSYEQANHHLRQKLEDFKAAESLIVVASRVGSAYTAYKKQWDYSLYSKSKIALLAEESQLAALEYRDSGELSKELRAWLRLEQQLNESAQQIQGVFTAKKYSIEAQGFWLRRQALYDFEPPQSVEFAEVRTLKAEALEASGDLGQAIELWAEAEKFWFEAYDKFDDQVVEIESRKAAADAQAKSAAKQQRVKVKQKRIADTLKRALPEMIRITGGVFGIGCVSGQNCQKDERPTRQVTMGSFAMASTEVTFSNWDYCVASGGCKYIPNDNGWGRGDRPVINVSFKDVTQQFIPWLNKVTGKTFRLPSESEWEFAARAGSSTQYSWGNTIGVGMANCSDCGSRWDGQQTAPVSSFKSNVLGLFDMFGNVYEWVGDCWHDQYDSLSAVGAANLSGDCSLRVIRGGSWYDLPNDMRAAARNAGDGRSNRIGFRLVHDL